MKSPRRKIFLDCHILKQQNSINQKIERLGLASRQQDTVACIKGEAFLDLLHLEPNKRFEPINFEPSELTNFQSH